MARRWVCTMLALVLLCPGLFPLQASETPGPVLRALLVACDDFVTQPDTTPSSYNNLVAVRRALLYDARSYSRIRVSVNQALDAESFSQLALEAFGDARPQDTSLFYLSTHGIQVEGSPDFFALMSDGQKETMLSARELHQALAGIQGTKVIILDACYSGAAIGKGTNLPEALSVFTGPDFKVLTSSGALEPSFLWTDGAGTVQGGSFFAQALIEGISAEGNFAADRNRDGIITLEELYSHQLKAYGASTPQAYPQNDSTPVFTYKAGSPAAGRLRTVSGLSLDTPVIHAREEPLVFSYTLNRQARLAYQLVYRQEGTWRFRQPQSIADPGRGDGLVLPGRKEVALALQPQLEGMSGYLLMMIVTVVEDRSRPQACVLLSVQAKGLQSPPRVDSGQGFSPTKGEEMPFILRHDGPAQFTARVVDEMGEEVAVLCYNRMSRPLHLLEEGSSLFWDGRLPDGSLARPGKYRLSALLRAGGEQYEVMGEVFELLP